MLPFSSVLGNLALGYALLALLAEVYKRLFGPGFNVKGKHVFITGGSTGLGLELAKLCATRGASVTVAARSVKPLEAAVAAITECCPDKATQKVVSVQCDVSSEEQTRTAVDTAVKEQGVPVDVLVCNAGTAVPGHFGELKTEVFRKQMDVNYFGALNAVRAVFPSMAERRSGMVIFVSSGAAMAGMIGYTAYCASKFAVRGLSDCLRNELKAHNIRVHLYLPANIDTPGFVEENKTKPKETVDIESSGGTVSPASAAKELVAGVSLGHYTTCNDIGLSLLRLVSRGVAPPNNTLLEAALAPVASLAATGFTWWADHVVSSSTKAKAD